MSGVVYKTIRHMLGTGTLVTWDGQGKVDAAVVRTQPCRVVRMFGTNTSGSARYIQIHDATSAPANTAVPALPAVAVAAGASFNLDLGFDGVQLANGVVVASSTTSDTLTLTGAADLLVAVTTLT